MNKIKEIREELQMVLTGRSGYVDVLLPPVLFVLLNTIWNLQVAIWTALGLTLVLVIYRLRKRQSLLYAIGGTAGVMVALITTTLLGRAEGFFVPTIISGGFTMVLCLVSVLVRRPIVAFTSFIARRWPLSWYWHPKVRPAYSEVTWVWFVFFGLRFLLQFNLFQSAATAFLGVIQILTGWPATIILLIVSYLYGTWRLQKLGGPSVEEFKVNAAPPWESQKRGF